MFQRFIEAAKTSTLAAETIDVCSHLPEVRDGDLPYASLPNYKEVFRQVEVDARNETFITTKQLSKSSISYMGLSPCIDKLLDTNEPHIVLHSIIDGGRLAQYIVCIGPFSIFCRVLLLKQHCFKTAYELETKRLAHRLQLNRLNIIRKEIRYHGWPSDCRPQHMQRIIRQNSKTIKAFILEVAYVKLLSCFGLGPKFIYGSRFDIIMFRDCMEYFVQKYVSVPQMENFGTQLKKLVRLHHMLGLTAHPQLNKLAFDPKRNCLILLYGQTTSYVSPSSDQSAFLKDIDKMNEAIEKILCQQPTLFDYPLSEQQFFLKEQVPFKKFNQKDFFWQNPYLKEEPIQQKDDEEFEFDLEFLARICLNDIHLDVFIKQLTDSGTKTHSTLLTIKKALYESDPEIFYYAAVIYSVFGRQSIATRNFQTYRSRKTIVKDEHDAQKREFVLMHLLLLYSTEETKTVKDVMKIVEFMIKNEIISKKAKDKLRYLQSLPQSFAQMPDDIFSVIMTTAIMAKMNKISQVSDIFNKYSWMSAKILFIYANLTRPDENQLLAMAKNFAQNNRIAQLCFVIAQLQILEYEFNRGKIQELISLLQIQKLTFNQIASLIYVFVHFFKTSQQLVKSIISIQLNNYHLPQIKMYSAYPYFQTRSLNDYLLSSHKDFYRRYGMAIVSVNPQKESDVIELQKKRAKMCIIKQNTAGFRKIMYGIMTYLCNEQYFTKQSYIHYFIFIGLSSIKTKQNNQEMKPTEHELECIQALKNQPVKQKNLENYKYFVIGMIYYFHRQFEDSLSSFEKCDRSNKRINFQILERILVINLKLGRDVRPLLIKFTQVIEQYLKKGYKHIRMQIAAENLIVYSIMHGDVDLVINSADTLLQFQIIISTKFLNQILSYLYRKGNYIKLMSMTEKLNRTQEPIVLFYEAACLYQYKKYNQSQQRLLQFQKIVENHQNIEMTMIADSYIFLSYIVQERGNFEKSHEYQDKALGLYIKQFDQQPSDIYCCLKIAQTLMRINRDKEALRYMRVLNMTIEIGHSKVEQLELLEIARCCLKNKKDNQALYYLKKFHEENQSEPWVLNQLARLYLGMNKQARFYQFANQLKNIPDQETYNKNLSRFLKEAHESIKRLVLYRKIPNSNHEAAVSLRMLKALNNDLNKVESSHIVPEYFAQMVFSKQIEREALRAKQIEIAKNARRMFQDLNGGKQ